MYKNKNKLIHILVLIAIVLLAVISLQAGSAATTYSINNTTVGGINGALGTATDGDTIELDEGNYTGNTNTNMTINKNITIQGKTKDKVILDAQGLSRIYTVNNNYNVTFINITFTNANASGNGGAILANVGAMMTIIKCTFTNNYASGNGGAIQTQIPAVLIEDSVFIDNYAVGSGGAILLNGNGSIIRNSTFRSNEALNSNGGAVNVNPSAVNTIITDSTFVNNSAGATGGAILSYSQNLTVRNCNFSDNYAVEGGGAIRIATGNSHIINCSLNNNGASLNGGGIRAEGNNNTITNCTITNNSAPDGGGIYIKNGNTTISSNNITDNGGNGVSNNGTTTLNNNNISGNAGDGVSNNGTAEITGNNIIDNGGNGIANGEDGDATIESNNIMGNNRNLDNDGNIGGSNNVMDESTDLVINISVSGNKVTIRVKAIDGADNVIVGQSINFYINGKLIGTAITDSNGIAELIYNVSSSGNFDLLATLDEFNTTDSLGTTIYYGSNVTGSFNATPFNINPINLPKSTVITVSTPTINEGKKTNIQVILKDINGSILKNKKVSITIKGKTYTATTNNNGIAIFKIANLKGGKYTVTAKFAGDNTYKSSTISGIQKVNSKVNLGIISIKKIKSSNKKNPKYKITIINKGSLKSKATVLSIFHIRNGKKIKTKYFNVKAIGTGKKISIIVDYFPDRAKHGYCIAYYTLDPKNKNKEILLANNKKSISLKH